MAMTFNKNKNNIPPSHQKNNSNNYEMNMEIYDNEK